MEVLLISMILNILVYESICETYLSSFSSRDILKNVDSHCFVLANQQSSPQLLATFHQLSVVYLDDPDVIIGTTALHSFTWPNGEKLRLKGQIKWFQSFDGAIVYFRKTKVDRNCLLKSPSSWNPLAELYEFRDSIELLVSFVNEICNAFRTVHGKITFQGLHRQNILNNLFSLMPIDVTMADLYHSRYQNPFLNISTSKVFSENTGYSSCSSQDNLKSEIPKCDRIKLPLDADEFFHSYVKTSKPVIIEKGAIKWPAFRKWTMRFLKEKYGNNEVHVKLTPGGDFEGVESADLWENFDTFKIPEKIRMQLRFPELVVVRPAGVNMNFSEFLDLIQWASVQKERNVSAYLEYSSIPNYMADLESDILDFEFAKNLKRQHLNLWLSDGHTLGRLHFDPYDNLLCQLKGRKQVIMFEPHDNTKLYEGHIPQATLSYSAQLKKFRRKSLEDTTSMVMSPVDILKPDFKKYPKFSEAVPLNCTINEGDVLFMPAFWWHEVYSWPNTTENRNMAVNFWFEPFLQKEFPCEECHLDVNPYYYHLL